MKKLQKKYQEMQDRFCEEYIVDLNATQAAVRSGYSKRTANEQGCRLLAKVSIRNEIQRLKAERSNRVGIKADDVVLELAKVAFSNIADYANIEGTAVKFTEFKNIAPDKLAAVESIGTTKAGKLTLKLHSKLNALEQLGKHLGIYEADNTQRSNLIFNVVHFANNPKVNLVSDNSSNTK